MRGVHFLALLGVVVDMNDGRVKRVCRPRQGSTKRASSHMGPKYREITIFFKFVKNKVSLQVVRFVPEK